jgi:intracellular multiplication protein IcmE
MADTNKGALSGLKTLSPKAKKTMLIFGGVAVVVVVVTGTMMSRDKHNSVPASATMLRAPTNVAGDPTASTSIAYKDLIRQDDVRRNAEAADIPGKMVLPQIAGLSDPNAKALPSIAMTPPINVQREQVFQQPEAQQPVRQQQENRQPQGAAYNNVLAVMQKIVSKSLEGDNGSFATITAPQAANSGVSGQAGAATGTNAIAAAAAQQGANAVLKPVPVMRAGEAAFGTLDTAVNSDFSGPVVATIHEGKFKGARVLGSKSLEQNAVVMKFTMMSLADGSATIPIDAYAIQIADAKKFGLSAVSGDVDHHIFTRYLLPAAASFIQAYGTAAAQPQQSISQNASTTTQTTDQLSPRQRLIVATGALATPVTNDMQQLAARPITVSLDAGTEIGIMFAKDVTTADMSGVQPNTAVQTGAAAQAAAQLAAQASQQALLIQSSAANSTAQRQYAPAASAYPYQNRAASPYQMQQQQQQPQQQLYYGR